MFDETYYAKEAFALINGGRSRAFVENADVLIINGTTENVMLTDPTFTVHPEVGKWLIGAGIELFGMNPTGWRIAAAIFGSLTVLVLARIVWNLTASVWASTFAGLLLALDGLHFTMSRIAMLDIFLAFWIMLGVLFVIKDRGKTGWLRPWQIAAGISFGLAVGTKWSALYVLAAFGIAVWVWDRRENFQSWFVAGVAAFVRLVVVALLVYVSTWTGWLNSSNVYRNAFAESNNWPEKTSEGFAQSLRDLGHYHRQTLEFHTGEYMAKSTHGYASKPLSWLVLKRPVNVYAQNSMPAKLCGAPEDSKCVQQVLLLGNPVIWWGGLAAMGLAIFAAAISRNWRWSIPILGFAATWLPWFTSGTRPIFQFYAVVVLPFIIISIALVAQRGLNYLKRKRPNQTEWGYGMIAAFAVLALLAFSYFYPILTGATIEVDKWNDRMWFTSWI